MKFIARAQLPEGTGAYAIRQVDQSFVLVHDRNDEETHLGALSLPQAMLLFADLVTAAYAEDCLCHGDCVDCGCVRDDRTPVERIESLIAQAEEELKELVAAEVETASPSSRKA